MDERVSGNGVSSEEQTRPGESVLPAEDVLQDRYAADDAIDREPVAEAGHRPRPLNLDTLIWAAALVWAGAVLLAANLGYLERLSFQAFDLPWDLPFSREAWSLVFVGTGLLVGIDILVRLIVPRYRRNVIGYVILAIVLISLGLGRTELVWPLILLVVGAALLLRQWRRRGR
ncbi:MAG: hypothetical protein ACP5HG_06045 [Anaerolineae bacterium]